MRKTKFQAWYQGKMYEVVGLFFNSEGVVTCGIRSGADSVHSVHYMSHDQVKLRQFTGLLDKHGKEIYEGDILLSLQATAKVVFWERPPEFGLDFSHNEDVWCEDWNLTDDSDRMEVIGNIHEHPELLQEGGAS